MLDKPNRQGPLDRFALFIAALSPATLALLALATLVVGVVVGVSVGLRMAGPESSTLPGVAAAHAAPDGTAPGGAGGDSTLALGARSGGFTPGVAGAGVAGEGRRPGNPGEYRPPPLPAPSLAAPAVSGPTRGPVVPRAATAAADPVAPQPLAGSRSVGAAPVAPPSVAAEAADSKAEGAGDRTPMASSRPQTTPEDNPAHHRPAADPAAPTLTEDEIRLAMASPGGVVPGGVVPGNKPTPALTPAPMPAPMPAPAGTPPVAQADGLAPGPGATFPVDPADPANRATRKTTAAEESVPEPPQGRFLPGPLQGWYARADVADLPEPQPLESDPILTDPASSIGAAGSGGVGRLSAPLPRPDSPEPVPITGPVEAAPAPAPVVAVTPPAPVVAAATAPKPPRPQPSPPAPLASDSSGHLLEETLPGGVYVHGAAPTAVQTAPLTAPLEQALAAPGGLGPRNPPWRRYAVAAGGWRRPAIAVVIDDLGLDRTRTRAIVALPPPLTLAYLAYADDIAPQMETGRARGHELLIHMPMEPLDGGINPGPNALRVGLSEAEILDRLRRNLDRGVAFVGINNHMGSRFTSDPKGMAVVMGELKRRGLLWLDSVTSSDTVGLTLARMAGVPHAGRSVFLDHVPERAAVNRQLARLEQEARTHGLAVGIGHPKDATIAALKAWLPTLAAKGIALVPVSAIAQAGDMAEVAERR